jgi:hypothetical protein
MAVPLLGGRPVELHGLVVDTAAVMKSGGKTAALQMDWAAL